MHVLEAQSIPTQRSQSPEAYIEIRSKSSLLSKRDFNEISTTQLHVNFVSQWGWRASSLYMEEAPLQCIDAVWLTSTSNESGLLRPSFARSHPWPPPISTAHASTHVLLLYICFLVAEFGTRSPGLGDTRVLLKLASFDCLLP
jgi:hypothetical protein